MHLPTPATPRESAPERSSKRLLYALIVLLTIFAAGVTVALFYERDKPAANAQAQPSPAAQNQITAKQSVASSPTPDNRNESPYNLNGAWVLLDTVESTSYLPYANSQVGFQLTVNHVGAAFTAQGQKYLINGRELPSGQRTAIRITGTIDADTIHATFVESGTRRDGTGTFTWKIENEGKSLRGRFASNAARSSGASVATKQ